MEAKPLAEVDPRVERSSRELLARLYTRRLLSFQVLTLPALVFYCIRSYWEDLVLAFGVVSVALLNNLVTIWMARQPRLRAIAAPQYIAGVYLLVLLLACTDGMLQSEVLWFVGLAPALSSLTMGVRALKFSYLMGLVVILIPCAAELWWPEFIVRTRDTQSVTGLRLVNLGLLAGFGWLAAWHGIRQKAQIEEQNNELDLARAQVEKAAASKSEFLATMSHEIRTPMNGILGTAQHLRGCPLDEEHQEHALAIVDSGNKLMDVLNAILDLSKIEAGKFNLRHTALRLEQILREVRDECNASTEQARVQFDHRDHPRHLPMHGDPSRIAQVLRNLIVALLSQSPKGPVELTLRDEGRLAQIEIRLPQVQLSPQSLRLLATPTAYLAENYDENHRIALAMKVSHEIVRLMGGQLAVETSALQGSWARWTVDRNRNAADTPLESSLGDEPSSLSLSQGRIHGQKVLVVDDNAINRRVARMQLEQLGCVVTLAENGAQAVRLCEDTPFCAVFMDLQMPGLSGIQATQQIRESTGPNAQTPIIAFTADAYDADIDTLEAVGMNGHLEKPFRVQALRRLLSKLDAPSVDRVAS